MSRQASTEERILGVAREIVLRDGWAALSMRKLAREARLSLAELYARVPDKAALIRLFLRETDLKVLAKPHAWTSAERPRDRVFDVLMTRFETLAAERGFLRALLQGARRAPLDMAIAIPALVTSMRWMLEKAEVEASVTAAVALAGVYASVLPVWAEDDDPGLAKTMAALDRRLRRIEQLLRDRTGAKAEEEKPAPTAPRKSRKRSK